MAYPDRTEPGTAKIRGKTRWTRQFLFNNSTAAISRGSSRTRPNYTLSHTTGTTGITSPTLRNLNAHQTERQSPPDTVSPPRKQISEFSLGNTGNQKSFLLSSLGLGLVHRCYQGPLLAEHTGYLLGLGFRFRVPNLDKVAVQCPDPQF